jgi:N-acetylglucosaminyldiphosphoundecaprenol N-acetyl-beta-D-mannosaminyltransferase
MSGRVDILGCSIDNLSMEETLSKIESFIQSGEPHQHGVVNVDKVVKSSRDPELRRIINQCALVSVDGMPVVWASRLLGKPLKERVAGVDLFTALVKRSAIRGWRVFFLGGREEVVRAVKDYYGRNLPRLQIAGYRNGYWKPEEEAAVVKQITDSHPQLLFVAISSPQKEQFLGRYQAEMKVPFAMGVGGTFDVVTGRVKRAPIWMQKSGLEWFYRFLQEPGRMFKRYFIDDMYFFWLLFKEIAQAAETFALKRPRRPLHNGVISGVSPSATIADEPFTAGGSRSNWHLDADNRIY